jgi:aspartokinase
MAEKMKARLQVMKFGGTSVGDASCIARTVRIIAQAARENGCVAVVSAMSGVTNRLIEAAKAAESGNAAEAAAILDALEKQHEAALSNLIPD